MPCDRLVRPIVGPLGPFDRREPQVSLLSGEKSFGFVAVYLFLQLRRSTSSPRFIAEDE